MNSECSDGVCVDGECIVKCREKWDCHTGYFCNELGVCQKEESTSSGSTTSGTAGAGGNPTTSSGTAGTGTGGGSTTGSTSSGSGGGKELDLCGNDGDCTGGLSCKDMVKYGKKRCTRGCSSNAQCMSGTRCIDGFCLGDDIGRSCKDPSSCNFACMQLDPGYCTAACSSGADCPNGYGCMGIGQPPVDVCVRAEALCGPGQTSACVGSSFCDTSPNMILGGCTTECSSSADCPQRAAPLAKWSCNGLLCQRPGDVYGPLPGGYKPVEYHCNASLQPVALCNDAQHIDFVNFLIPPPPNVDCNSGYTTAGSANDSCVNSCRYQGGCAYGYACVGVGGVNNERIGLCLPTGNNEPGGSCSNDPQCSFGYCSNGKCSRDCTADGICPGGLSCVAGPAPAVEGKTFMRCE